MANWDPTFVRDGKGIAEWLPQLVSDDAAARHAAAEALGGMWQAKPAYSTRWDDVLEPGGDGRLPVELVDQADRFAQAVRDAVEQPSFPHAEFVRRLLLYRLSLDREWVSQGKAKQLPSPSDVRLAEHLVRHHQVTRYAEALQASGMASYVVLQSLAAPLLDAPDLLHEMLDQPSVRPHAIEALQRLGASAAPFADRLMRDLDNEGRESGSFDAAVIGNIARTDGVVARALVARLRADSNEVVTGAASALAHAGPDGLPPALVDEAIMLLRGSLHVSERWVATVRALASLGRSREDALNEVLALAVPRPPRLRRTAGKYPVEYDLAMHERGFALEALRHFTSFPDRVVPVLVDAIESFEEFDPDWEYDRAEHGRVVESLRAFGPAAGVLAAPILARHLRQSDGELDREVIRLLGDIGPAAAAALPALEALFDEVGPPDETLAPQGARNADPVHWAVRRIRGQDAEAV